MGWIKRRVAGFLVFAVASAILGAFAVSRGWLTGEPTLGTATGATIVGISFLLSLAVSSRMKKRDRIRKAQEQNAPAWSESDGRAEQARRR